MRKVVSVQLPPGQQAGERCRVLVGVESVFLGDADPGQGLSALPLRRI
jgi:hypothetical protein